MERKYHVACVFSQEGFEKFKETYKQIAESFLNKTSPEHRNIYKHRLQYDWQKELKNWVKTLDDPKTFEKNYNGDVLFEKHYIDWDTLRPEIAAFSLALRKVGLDNYFLYKCDFNKSAFSSDVFYDTNSLELKIVPVIDCFCGNPLNIKNKGFRFVFTEKGYEQFQNTIDEYYKDNPNPILPFETMANLIDNASVERKEHHIANQDNFEVEDFFKLIDIITEFASTPVSESEYIVVMIDGDDFYESGQFFDNEFQIRRDLHIEHLPVRMEEKEETGPSMR